MPFLVLTTWAPCSGVSAGSSTAGRLWGVSQQLTALHMWSLFSYQVDLRVLVLPSGLPLFLPVVVSWFTAVTERPGKDR